MDKTGENVISVAPGANGDLSVEDIESIADVIKESDYLILQLEIPIDAVIRAAQIAHEAGVYVILNPAPACELPSKIFQYISLITPNQTETELMTGVKLNNEQSFVTAVESFNRMGVKDVIITLGSKGSLVCSEGKHEFVPAIKVNAVDATAAGDTFCGAVCVALSQGKDLKEAAAFATKAASLTVQKMGAQDSIPSITDINMFSNYILTKNEQKTISHHHFLTHLCIFVCTKQNKGMRQGRIRRTSRRRSCLHPTERQNSQHSYGH